MSEKIDPTQPFAIGYNTAGVRYSKTLKKRILECVENSPLAGQFEWKTFYGDNEWQGIAPVGSDEDDMSQAFIVYSTDAVECLMGEHNSPWYYLSIELLKVMSTAIDDETGEPIFSSAGWPVVSDYENIELPEGIILDDYM